MRVANAVNNLRYGPDPTLGIVYLDSWQSHELRVATMRNTLESGVEGTKREKEQNQSDSRISLKKSKKKIITRNTSKKRRESLTQMKKEEKITR